MGAARTLEPSPRALEAVAREQRLLVLLDQVCPVPVPWPVAADAVAGVIVLERLPATPLLNIAHPDVEPLLGPLAAVLSALAAVPESAVEAWSNGTTNRCAPSSRRWPCSLTTWWRC